MFGHQAVQLADRCVVQRLDEQPTCEQGRMVEVVQLTQHEFRTSKGERELEQLIEQARVVEVDPDIGIADVNPAHAVTVDTCSEGSS